MSSNTIEESQEPSTINNISPEEIPGDRASINEEFKSSNWSEWPSWTSYALQKNKYFEQLLEPMLDLDNKQCTAWKDEVQNLLILAGLFSAVVTAFVIESYQTLQPDPNDQIIALLSRIADQMNATIGNAPPPAPSFRMIPGFVPSPSNVRVNIYWFISLVLSLAVALIGIIAQQWLREHQLYKKDMSAAQKFALFNARSDGLQRWYVPQIFAGLPLLLQTALVLFFVGLVDFLFSIHIDVAISASVAVAVPIGFLVATTVLPTLQLYTLYFPCFLRVNDHPPAPCPYKSPQALLVQNIAILSRLVFDLSARAFSILYIPFVGIKRFFASSSRSFYGKRAPFSTNDDDYRDCFISLLSTAGKWMTMDTEWLATRTSYAVTIHTPIAVHHPLGTYTSNINMIEITSYYDWVACIRRMASNSDPTDVDCIDALGVCVYDPLQRLFAALDELIQTSRTNAEVARALQSHFSALLRIISPSDYLQTESLVEISEGSYNFIQNAFTAMLMDQAWSSELYLGDHFIDVRLVTHMKLTRTYLLHNARKIFLCSNAPGVTPSFSPRSRLSLLAHRRALEYKNLPWMKCVSSLWSQTLKQMVMDICEMTPSQPFTRKCTRTPAARCTSNLHTESIAELTEYILLFQVRDEIQQTLQMLHDLCKSKPNPIRERAFVLITACAYINAVANVNQDDVEGFGTLLGYICELCGSLDPALEARAGGMGRYWTSVVLAFDYIRNNAYNHHVCTVAAASRLPGLLHNSSAAESV